MNPFHFVLPLLLLSASPLATAAGTSPVTSTKLASSLHASPHGWRLDSSVRAPRTAEPFSVPDGAGGQYVLWTDYRDGTADLYLLRVTSSGTPATGWPSDGVAVCDAPGGQSEAVMFPDGSGGVVVGWLDGRSGALGPEVYAQRVDGSGARLWVANGVKVLDAALDITSVAGAPDGSGGVLVAWSVGVPNGDVYAVRINGNGVVAPGWDGAGKAVCLDPTDQSEVAITSDGSGGAVVAWTDARMGTSEIWMQRLNSTSATQWTVNGIQIDTPVSGGHTPLVEGIGGANTIVIWTDYSGPTLAQRLDGTGAKQWNSGTPTTLHPGSGVGTPVEDFRSTLDGTGGVLVAWRSLNLGTYGLQAQRVSGAGAVQWGASGVSLVSVGGAFPSDFDLASDGAGGGLFSWSDDRNGLENDAYVQRVTAGGSAAWAANGVAASIFDREQLPTFVAPDGAGGLLVSWVDSRSEDPEIYSQHFNSTGDPQLAANGAPAFLNPGQQYAAGISQTSDGGAVVVWNEKRGGEYDIRALKLNADGTPAGPALLVTGDPGAQLICGFVDTGNGCIVEWSDVPTQKVMAQRISGAGAALWTAGGVEVAPGANFNETPRMISYPGGGAVFAWADGRSGPSLDIYAQRLDGTGARQWGTSGLGVCTDPAVERSPVLAYDGNLGAYIAWNDQRVTPGEIYLQHLGAAGAADLGTNGLVVGNGSLLSAVGVPSSPPYNQVILLTKLSLLDLGTFQITDVLYALKCDITGGLPWAGAVTVSDTASLKALERIVSDGAGGAYVAWSDSRSGPSDIFVQHVTSAGAAEWNSNGNVVCDASGWQLLGGMTVVAGGDLVFTWSDERVSQPDIYGQRMNPAGAAVLPANGVVLASAARGQFAPLLAPWKTAAPERLYLAWTDNRAGSTRYAYAQRLDLNLAAQWTPSGATATTATLASVEADAGHVTLVWYSADEVAATVYRRLEGAGWSAVGAAHSDGTGRIVFEDRAVEPGTRYAYRLGVREGGTEVFAGETWVEVPNRLELAIEGLRPNPAARDVVVWFTLPRPEAARLEWLDAAGRRVHVDDLSGLAAGRHALRFEGLPPPPGVYFLRLTQGASSITTRGTILK